MLGVSFSNNRISQDESSNSSTFSSYSTEFGSVDFSDREESIAELIEYLRSDSSGYDSD